MDINIGKVSMTTNRARHLPELNGSLDGVINGFCYWPASQTMIVNAKRKLTDNEISTLKVDILSLSDAEILNPRE